MNRITEIEIAGKRYPLNFSVKAAREFSERYGGLENIDKAFEDKSVNEMLDEVTWMLFLLIEQGAAYKKIVDGEVIDILTIEELEIVVGVPDLENLQVSLLGAMSAGMSREVEVEPDQKNAETTQDQ